MRAQKPSSHTEGKNDSNDCRIPMHKFSVDSAIRKNSAIAARAVSSFLKFFLV